MSSALGSDFSQNVLVYLLHQAFYLKTGARTFINLNRRPEETLMVSHTMRLQNTDFQRRFPVILN